MEQDLHDNRISKLIKDYSVIVGKKEIDEPKYDEYNTTLFDVYPSGCSAKKHGAFDYCLKMKDAFDGRAGRIASHSGWEFTYDFKFMWHGDEYLMHITKSYNRAFKIREKAE